MYLLIMHFLQITLISPLPPLKYKPSVLFSHTFNLCSFLRVTYHVLRPTKEISFVAWL